MLRALEKKAGAGDLESRDCCCSLRDQTRVLDFDFGVWGRWQGSRHDETYESKNHEREVVGKMHCCRGSLRSRQPVLRGILEGMSVPT